MFLNETSSFVAALLFSVHPVHTEAVSWIFYSKFEILLYPQSGVLYTYGREVEFTKLSDDLVSSPHIFYQLLKHSLGLSQSNFSFFPPTFSLIYFYSSFYILKKFLNHFCYVKNSGENVSQTLVPSC